MVFTILPAFAENNIIPIKPVISNSLPLPASALRALSNKVTAMAVESGFGALSSPIVLTSYVNIIDKVITSTAPAMCVIELEVYFYVTDIDEQVILAEKSITVKGVDRSEDKAVASAINKINPRSSEIRQFIQGAREKVISYYEQRVPVLMKKAELYAERKEYANALLILSDIPEGIKQWDKAAELASDIYIQMVDREAEELLHKAEVAISRNDYNAALDYISEISPQSNKIGKAKMMISEIKAENSQIVSLQKQIANMAEEKALLEEDYAMAMKEIRDYAQNQQELIKLSNVSMEEKVTNWLLGKMGEKPQLVNI